jgi:hypothetical protein
MSVRIAGWRIQFTTTGTGRVLLQGQGWYRIDHGPTESWSGAVDTIVLHET